MKEPKSQYIRVLDVLVIGPLMIYGGLRLSKEQNQALTGLGLTFFGVTTIGYNLRNYFEIRNRYLSTRIPSHAERLERAQEG